MPLKISSKFRSHARRLFATALLAAFALSILFVADGGPSARAQRKGKQGASQAANDNAAAPKVGTTKRVFVGGSSSTPQGSRVTIKSDNPLNDYSAYRSGDRFYVVVPGANAGSVAKGASGRGFSDMQVQQRGKDVVLSYKVQPGAKPKVEQKFNRLDVVFEAAEGTTPAPQDNARNAKTPANASQSPAANVTPPNQTSTPAQSQSAADRNAARLNAAGTSPSQSSSTALPAEASDASAPTSAAVAPSTPAAEQQLAQAQPPTTTAPITTTTTQPSAATGTSIGAVVMRNWPLALSLALLVVGVGLFFAARRTSAATEAAPEPAKAETGAALKAASPSKLKDASSTLSTAETKRAAGTSAAVAAAVAPVVSKPAASPDSSSAKRKKEDKKKRGKERAQGEKAVAAQETGAVAPAETAISSTETTAATSTETAAAVVPTETVAQEAALTSSIAALSSTAAASEAAEPAAEESTAEVARAIEPAVSLDGDVVQTETKRLLDGEPFDQRVVGTSDIMARQIIGAELLAALAGRNAERRERARAAFVAHGYLDEAAKDLGGASAPAERASAARSLGLTGEHSATPRLVAALEDPSVEVRRAAVEALALLRDTSAVEPLEDLLEREKKTKTKVNRKLVQHAIDACREGVPETPAPPSVEPAVAAASVAEITPEVESGPAPESALVEEIATAPATETAPELLVTEDASVETVTQETAIEVVPAEEAAAEEVFAEEAAAEEAPAAETAIEEASAAVESPVVEDRAVEETAIEPAPPVEEVAVSSVEEVEAEPAFVGETAIEPAPFEEATRELVPVEDESAAPVEYESAVEESAVVEETAAVEETPVVEETEVVEESAVEEPATVEAAETFEAAPFAGVSEAELLRESPVKDFELWDDEVETPTVEAAPVEEATTFEAEEVAAVAEPRPFEEAPRAVEVEEFTLTPPAPEAAPALEDESPASVSEVKDIESSRELEPSLPFSTTVEEEAQPARLVGEKGLEPARAAETSDWVELDMSEPETPAPSYEPSAMVFETSGGDALAETDALSSSRPETRLEEYTAETSIAAPEVETGDADEHFAAPDAPAARVSGEEKSVELFDEFSTVPASIQQRLVSSEPGDRADAILELSRLDTSEAFHQICAAFDDEAREVRSAAARALFDLRADRAESFTRALRESDAERRRNIGTAISASGLASEAISQLTGESREKTYEAFSLLFLMAKAGEVQPLIRAIEGHPSNEVRLAVVKLLALSGQKEVLPAFRRLAVRGSLPTEVRSAVMEAIYQISSSGQPDPTHA
jgi:hypothetical protein